MQGSRGGAQEQRDDAFESLVHTRKSGKELTGKEWVWMGSWRAFGFEQKFKFRHYIMPIRVSQQHGDRFLITNRMIFLRMVVNSERSISEDAISSALWSIYSWLNPQPGSSQQAGIKKELTPVLEPGSLLPAVEASVTLDVIQEHLS